MEWPWFLVLIFVILVGYFRSDLRQRMFWAGLFALPVMLIKPLLLSNFFVIAADNGGILYFLLTRIIFSFSFGALASAIYEVLLQKRITPGKHPLRPKLAWLLLGPILLLLLVLVFKQSYVVSLIFALVLDLVLALYLRRDLVWDVIFSGTIMGFLYLLIFLIIYRGLPGTLDNFWFTDSTIGFNLFSVPVEEIVVVILFGSLWGPLYIAVKDIREK